MKKTVTKEEVERVLEQYLTPITKEPILNELFPSELEDDRVEFSFIEEGVKWVRLDLSKRLKALNGHYFKTNDDGTEVTLHKRESC